VNNKARNYIFNNIYRGAPRERAMPLVPQLFPGVSLSRHSVFTGSRPISDRWSKFCPNLNAEQYGESLGEIKKTELYERAMKLCKRAIYNQLHKVSEFCWEVSAWSDVFGLLYEDERFLMSVISLFHFPFPI
jgi:hypothetical protein